SRPRPVRKDGDPVRLTYSDITMRFAIPALREAIRKDVPLDPDTLMKNLRELVPTSIMDDGTTMKE
ncbi:MAG: hypothetical protein KJP07_15595, partial [Desulfatitalea sp.]|nr:hypothetical protein [Desulfatitalea sp.]